MDDQSHVPLSQMKPDAVENKTESTDEPNIILVESLRATTGQSGGPLATAVNEFLSGEGALHETTRAALTQGSSAVNEVAAFLTTNFKLSSTAATLVATLLVKLFPSIRKVTGKKTAAKKKPRRKVKPKTTAKKTAAKKKKTTSQAVKKKASSKTKPQKAKRTTSVEDA